MGASGEWVVKQGHEANFFAAWTRTGVPVLCEPPRSDERAATR
jgi:hypothetical protein